jgi:hypothetical protein
MDVATGMRWSAEDLAQQSAIGVTTIRVEFIDENGGGVGVRLRKRRLKKVREDHPH